MKDELDGKIMTEFASLRPNTYSYLTDNKNENKKAEATKMCVIKRNLEFENYKHCLEANQLENEINNLKTIKLIQIVSEKIIIHQKQ